MLYRCSSFRHFFAPKKFWKICPTNLLSFQLVLAISCLKYLSADFHYEYLAVSNCKMKMHSYLASLFVPFFSHYIRYFIVFTVLSPYILYPEVLPLFWRSSPNPDFQKPIFYFGLPKSLSYFHLTLFPDRV